MHATGLVLRRALYGVFAVCAFGGAVAVTTVPSATAASDPCSASEIARTVGSVAIDTGDYLDSHPKTNAALTSAAQQSGPQALASLKTYFDANPQAAKDLHAIQRPLAGLSGKCRLPITMPQLLQMMQGAQQSMSAPDAELPAVTTPLPGPRSAHVATAPVGLGSA